jgi:catechol 2,3-dioxygenase-like lactoylglutathione lyase family enzyme
VIDQLFPILDVADVERSLRFWRDQLGGMVAFEWPGPDGRPIYVGLDLGSSHLGIGGAGGRAARLLAVGLHG